MTKDQDFIQSNLITCFGGVRLEVESLSFIPHSMSSKALNPTNSFYTCSATQLQHFSSGLTKKVECFPWNWHRMTLLYILTFFTTVKFQFGLVKCYKYKCSLCCMSIKKTYSSHDTHSSKPELALSIAYYFH